MNTNIRLSFYKYLHKLGGADFIGVACPVKEEVWLAIFTKEDYINITEGKWEFVSPACRARMGYKPNKKHVRTYTKTKDFCNYAIRTATEAAGIECKGVGDDTLVYKVSKEQWLEYKSRAKRERGQANNGFATEYAFEDWKDISISHKGIDVPGMRMEIKWAKGGQFVL